MSEKHAGAVDVVVDDPGVIADVVRLPVAFADVYQEPTKPTVSVSASSGYVTADVVTSVGQGPPGDDGPRGSLWWVGDGPPVEITGALPNDMYLDNLTGDVYTLGGVIQEPGNETAYGEAPYGTGPYGGI